MFYLSFCLQLFHAEVCCVSKHGQSIYVSFAKESSIFDRYINIDLSILAGILTVSLQTSDYCEDNCALQTPMSYTWERRNSMPFLVEIQCQYESFHSESSLPLNLMQYTKRNQNSLQFASITKRFQKPLVKSGMHMGLSSVLHSPKILCPEGDKVRKIVMHS